MIRTFKGMIKRANVKKIQSRPRQKVEGVVLLPIDSIRIRKQLGRSKR